MKKILAVATAIVLAISSLCVFVFADETELNLSTVVMRGSVTNSSGTYTIKGSDYNTDGSNYIEIPIDAIAPGESVDITIKGTATATLRVWLSASGANANYSDVKSGTNEDISTTNGWTFTLTNNGTVDCDVISIKHNWSDLELTLSYVGITYPNSTSTSETITIDGVEYDVVYSDSLDDLVGWKTILELNSTTKSYLEESGAILRIEFSDTVTSIWAQLYLHYNYTQEQIGSTWDVWGSWNSDHIDIDVAEVGLTSSSNWSSGDELIFNFSNYGVTMIGIKILVPASSDVVSTASGIIYVNEDYHALLLNGYFISIPHTDDNGDGYCDVCCEYIGTEDAELEVVTVDGVDYYVVVSNELNLASSSWTEVSLGDATFAAALNTEGAILQITRDTETSISYVSTQAWEKFHIAKDYANYITLSTPGTTVDDEPESNMVAYVSDDGYTITYDGATVYAALEAAGLANLSSYDIITSTSGSYTITSVAVLVPVGTVVGEDVDVTEPAEEGDTTTEDDGEEDADSVDVGDNDDAAAESNPTTGVVLALVPMAIAGFAVVSSKRR